MHTGPLKRQGPVKLPRVASAAGFPAGGAAGEAG